MKVVFVTYDSANDVGGVSSWLLRLLPRLKAAGLDVEVHVLTFSCVPGINCAEFEKRGIPLRWKPWEEDTRKAVRNCLELIEESQPDIYVPNCILPAYYAVGSVRKQRIYSVGVLHSDDPFYWGLVDEFMNGAPSFRLSAVVTISKFLEEAVYATAKVHNIILRRISGGVPLPDQQAKAPDEVFRLVYTGRLVEEQKRISEVTRALCAVVAQNPKIEAWIIGQGDALANIKKIIETSGVDPNRCRLLGRVESVYAVLGDCHAFVLLSDYEGLPSSLLEAMAFGVVPICLDMRSGIREAVEPGYNGLIVKDRKEDFYSAVHALERDTALWFKLSNNARQTAKQIYSEETCAAAWVEFLRSFKPINRPRPIKAPTFLQLPRRNPKFGQYDQRNVSLIKNWSRLRMAIGYYRRKLFSVFNQAVS